MAAKIKKKLHEWFYGPGNASDIRYFSLRELSIIYGFYYFWFTACYLIRFLGLVKELEEYT